MKGTLRKIVLLVLVLPLLAFDSGHKFYVSVTHIRYSQKDDALQITTRIFIDDLERLLEERYGFEAYLATPEESNTADEFIEKYIKTRFILNMGGTDLGYDFLGKKYDNDVIVCYMEVPKIDLVHGVALQVQNDILTDLFEEQQNVVHIRIKEKKKSFVLFRENNKGMLNL